MSDMVLLIYFLARMHLVIHWLVQQIMVECNVTDVTQCNNQKETSNFLINKPIHLVR